MFILSNSILKKKSELGFAFNNSLSPTASHSQSFSLLVQSPYERMNKLIISMFKRFNQFNFIPIIMIIGFR